MKTLQDGSIQFEQGEVVPPLASYQPHLTIPNNFVPKFQPCKYRSFVFKKESCGKIIGTWRCSLLNETVSVQFCNKCVKREIPDKEDHTTPQ